jgi:hypothetical protein
VEPSEWCDHDHQPAPGTSQAAGGGDPPRSLAVFADPPSLGPNILSESRDNLEVRHSQYHIQPSNTRPTEKALITLLPAALACRRWELQQRHMTPPSNVALRIVVEEDDRLVRSLNAGYADATADGGLDTDVRDALLDVIGRHFTGKLWPRSGGMDATRRFMADLQRGMIRASWTVDLLAVA